LKIGTRFVKAYYKTLTENPDQIVHFYQSSSSVSFGKGSEDAETTEIASAAQRFLDGNSSMDHLRFEFENGAIDAQTSVNNGILLVVTGYIVMDETRRGFVHTFFLNTTNKRSYYVHNDVLRFLDWNSILPTALEESINTTNENKEKDKEDVITEPTIDKISASPELVEEPSVVQPTVVTIVEREVKDVVVSEPEPLMSKSKPAVEENDEAPGNGVEESKEAILEDSDEEVETEQPKPLPAVPEPSKPILPGSWASLVAKPALSASPGTPIRAEKAANVVKPETPKRIETTNNAVPTPKAAKPTPTPAAPAPRKQRGPDMTLVVKNIDSSTVDTEILTLFEPFALTTKTKIVGATVSANRGIAFIDYDSAEPVVAAVEQQKMAPFFIRGRKLEIYQKTAEVQQRSRKPSGGRSGGKESGRGGKDAGRAPHRRGSGGGRVSSGEKGGGDKSASGGGGGGSGGRAGRGGR
jgi:hypothetical protein